MSVAVRVADGYQVVHDGIVYRPGDTPEVPDALADEWARHGWVVRSVVSKRRGPRAS